MVLEPLSDEILAEQARGGDTKAFEALFDRYKKPILNLIYRLIGNRETAEEVTQEVFIKVYNNLNVFDPKKKFATWMYTIAHNLSKNSLRDRKYFADKSLDDVIFPGDQNLRLKDIIEDPAADPNRIIEDEELAEEAQKVLDSLPIKYKEVIVLCSIQGLTYKEASAILGCSIAAVAARLEKAKILFMKQMGISAPRRKGGGDIS